MLITAYFDISRKQIECVINISSIMYVWIISKLPHLCHPFFRVFWGLGLFKKDQTSLTCLKKHTRYFIWYSLGVISPWPARNCFVVAAALITNLYRESLIRAFSSGWNAQHSSAHTRERKISKPRTLLLDHFTIKCHQLHLLICQVTVTLAIRVICASFLHSAELLVLVAQLPSLHWHWTRDWPDVRRKPLSQWAPRDLFPLLPNSSCPLGSMAPFA